MMCENCDSIKSAILNLPSYKVLLIVENISWHKFLQRAQKRKTTQWKVKGFTKVQQVLAYILLSDSSSTHVCCTAVDF